MKESFKELNFNDDDVEMLLDKQVLIFCLSYIYTGKLIGVNKRCVLLENPSIVYETGAFDKESFIDAQKLPFQLYIQLSSIESFGETNKK